MDPGLVFAFAAGAGIGILILAGVWFRRRRRRPAILVDGSNVMYWQGEPDLAPVRAVVALLEAAGFRVGVMFDANAGYLLSKNYQDDKALARTLALPEDQVLVVPKGTPADIHLLGAARDLGARIVTNDRFRDWIDDYPDIADSDRLLGGRFDGDRLVLDID